MRNTGYVMLKWRENLGTCNFTDLYWPRADDLLHRMNSKILIVK